MFPFTLKTTGINPADQMQRVRIETSPKQVARFWFVLWKAAQPSEQIPLPIPVSNLLLHICRPESHPQGLLLYVLSNPDKGQMRIGGCLAQVGQAVSVLGVKQQNLGAFWQVIWTLGAEQSGREPWPSSPQAENLAFPCLILHRYFSGFFS